jgi:hypothetical protein
MILVIILIPLVWLVACRTIKKRCAKPMNEMLKKLDQVWIQIHSIETGGEKDREGGGDGGWRRSSTGGGGGGLAGKSEIRDFRRDAFRG